MRARTEGDDLRQDMLTLQMIRIMDRLWRNHGLDMQMSPYLCMSTGNEVGFIEVVLNADTTAHISKEAGGARAAFQEEPLNNWIKLHNVTPTQYATAQRNFMYSCAGYCMQGVAGCFFLFLTRAKASPPMCLALEIAITITS